MSDDKTEAERTSVDEHIDPDDPRYDGFRMTDCWLATMVGDDNQEGVLYVTPALAAMHHMSVGPAWASDERRLSHLRAFADYVHKQFDVEVHIRHFVPAPDDQAWGD